MKEYIEREALLNLIEENSETKFDWSESIGIDILRPAILDMPTADVAPVVHGEWKFVKTDENDMTVVQCSNCGINRYGTPVYCSRCGAKMDGGSK